MHIESIGICEAALGLVRRYTNEIRLGRQSELSLDGVLLHLLGQISVVRSLNQSDIYVIGMSNEATWLVSAYMRQTLSDRHQTSERSYIR